MSERPIRKVFSIGHVVEDIAAPENVAGGGGVYSARTANALGYETCIISKHNSDHRFNTSLASEGIQVITIPSKLDTITSFENIEIPGSKRKQVVLSRQEDIVIPEISRVLRENTNYGDNCAFIYAPVIGEVVGNVVNFLADYGYVLAIPQGDLRGVKEGKVFQRKMTGFEEKLRRAAVVVLSEEDVFINGQEDKILLQKLRSLGNIFILTRGEKGATIFQGEKEDNIYPFRLKPGEESLYDVGKGDVFATSFFLKYLANHNEHKAGVFAAFFAAIKILNRRVPTLGEIEKFKAKNPDRIRDFLEENGYRQRAA